MVKSDFWARFDQACLRDHELLKEILPADKVKTLIDLEIDHADGPTDHYVFYNWLASFFRDAIQYGKDQGKQ